MGVENNLSEIIGNSATEGLAQRLAIRGTKAIIHGNEALARAGNTRGYGLVDLDDPAFKGDGWRTMALVPSAYKETPELFYGPFLQVGTFMRQHGIIESDAGAFALDMLLDPINLATAGSLGLAGKATGGLVSGLTKVGRWSRLMSIFGEGGKITDGAVIFDKMLNTIETAGKVAGAGDEIIAAAKAGNKAGLKSLISTALESGKLSEADTALVNGLRQDRDLVINVLNKSNEFKQTVLKGGDFLQNSIRGRLAAKQVNPLLRIALPENPITHPIRFTTQMLGWEYEGERFLFPMSRQMAGGLDAVGRGTLAKSAATAGVPRVVEGMDIDSLMGLAKDVDKEFKSAGYQSGDLHGWQVAMNMSAFNVIVGAPNDRKLIDSMQLFGTPEEVAESLKSRFRTVRGLKAKAQIDPREFQKYVESVLTGAVEGRADIDKQLVARRDAIVGAAMDEAKTVADQAVAAGTINQAQADAHAAQLRRLVDVFSTKTLAWEATTPGNALAARRAVGKALARNMNDSVREIIRREYSGRHARNAMAEVFGSFMAHPGLFEKVDGKYLLAAADDVVKSEAPFLADTIERYNTRFGADKFNKLLRETGLSADVSLVAEHGAQLIKNIGENFIEHESVLDRLVTDYFPRVFRPNNKFFAAMKAKGVDVSWMNPHGISQEVEGEVIDRIFAGTGLADLRIDQGEGKATFEQVRKFSEERAIEFEKQGWGEYEKDGVRLFASYLDAANGAQLMNRLVRDMPQLSGNLTYSELIARFGQKWLDERGIKPQHVDGIKRIMRSDEIPEIIKPVFETLVGRPRELPLVDNPEALIRQSADKIDKKYFARDLVPDARQRVADKLGGKSRIGNIAIVDREGKEVAIDPTWVTTNSFPAWVRGREKLSPEIVSAVAVGPNPAEKNMPAWVRDALIDQGINPGRKLIELDLVDPAVQKALALESPEKLAAEGLIKENGVFKYKPPDTSKEAIEKLRAKYKLDELRYKNPKAGASKTPPIAYKVHSPKDVRLAVSELVNDELVTLSRRGYKAQEKLLAKGVKPAIERSSISVYRADFGHLQEAFSLYRRSRDPETALDRFFRKYDQWNYHLKSLVLFGDIFHFNTLAIGQVLTNPAALGENFVHDAQALIKGRNVRLSNTAVAAATGAAVGAGVGALEGENLESVAAFSIVGGLYGAAIASALKNARGAARQFMNPESLDTLMMMGIGGWSGRPDDRAIGVLNRGIRSMAERYARDPEKSWRVHPLDGLAHVIDGWDELLWNTMHNGSKHYYFSVQWERELPRLMRRDAFQKADDAGKWLMKSDLARQIVQSGNTFFGGEAFRFLLDDPGYQQVLRRFFLSPDWTASRLAISADYFMNMGPVKAELMGAGLGTLVDFAYQGGDTSKMSLRGPLYGAGFGFAMRKWAAGIQRRMGTPGDLMAREARRMAAAALVGGYTMAAALNLAFTGRPIWDNPEGRKTHVQLPDGAYVALGKAWVEPFEFAGFYGADRYPIPVISRSVSKGAVLPVRALAVLSNSSGFGGPLVTGKDGPFEMAHTGIKFAIDMGTPILAQGPLYAVGEAFSGGLQPQSVARATIRSLGFNISGQTAAKPDLASILRGASGVGLYSAPGVTPVTSPGSLYGIR